MEPAAGEDAEPDLQLGQAGSGHGSAGPGGESGALKSAHPEQEPPQPCGELPAAARSCWSPPAAEDGTEPLLPGHEELPAHGAPSPAGQDPPAARTPSPCPALRAGSPSLAGASGSIPSLDEDKGSWSGSAAAAPCHVAAGGEDECPICTEPYDEQRHRRALLNCGHSLCRGCLRAIMDAAGAAEFGRVRCPLCRQKTPMLEWEICKLQEELLLLHAQPSPAAALAAPRPPALPPRRPGLAGALEHRFQVRFLSSRTFGCLPCLRYPPGLIRRLRWLQGRCRCCYLLLLALLLLAETLSLLLIFLPVVLMVLLFLILDN